MIPHMRLGSFLLLSGAAFVTACAPSIRSERDADIPLPQGATWAWSADHAPAPDTGTARRYIPQQYTSASVDPIVRQRFRRAIEAAMQAKGFRRSEDPASSDFVVSLSFEGREAYRSSSVAPAVGFAWYGGWYRPWGFGAPWGFYRPWGWGWSPWGWGLGFATVPAYGYAAPYGYGGRAYRDGWLAVTLSLRSDGEVAWIGRYRNEEHRLREMPQEKVQQIVDKVFATLH